MKTRIDPIDAQARCVHDMLSGQCSWCLGHPDLPEIDGPHIAPDLGQVGLRWTKAEVGAVCARCGKAISRGRPVAYSIYDGGRVGECCEVAA